MTSVDQSLNSHVSELSLPMVTSPAVADAAASGWGRAKVEAELVRIWQDLLQIEDVSINDDFFNLGGDSILGARLMDAIDEKFQQRFELSRLFTHPTIADLAGELITAKKSSAAHIVPMHPMGTRTPLFCMHCATGHVLRYRALVSHLSPDVPVYGLRSPELKDLTKFPTVDELAAIYVDDIRKVQPQGPYQVCGFSFGGLVALEVARGLQAMGETVSLVLLLDSINPAHYMKMSFFQSLRMRSTYLRSRASTYGRNMVGGKWKQLYSDVAEFFWWRIKEFTWKRRRENAMLPEEMGPNAVQETVVMFATASAEYKPAPFPGRLVLLRSADRPRFKDELALGWDGVARDGIEVCTVPGDHFSVLEEPDVAGLANALNARLATGAPPA
jgi:thioesterase domain-containing protein/acyl carrier protein